MSCLQVPSKKQTERVKKRERGRKGEELETSGREIQKKREKGSTKKGYKLID